MTDSKQTFIVLEGLGGYTIAEVVFTGLEYKDFSFQTLSKMKHWFNEGESKISKVISFRRYLFGLNTLEKNPKTNTEQETLQPIDSLDFSVRTYNVLKRAGIDSLNQLKSLSLVQLNAMKNMNKKTRKEIEDRLDFQFK